MDLTAQLQQYDIWNALDETGLLLNIPRRPGESNRSYLDRLFKMAQLDVNTSTQGLVHGLSIFLDLDTYMVEDRTHFYLQHQPSIAEEDGSPADITIALRLETGTTLPAERIRTLDAFFQYDVTVAPAQTYPFYVWEDENGQPTPHVEFLIPPPDGAQLEVHYTTQQGDSYPKIHESGQTNPALVGQTGTSPTADQVKVIELNTDEVETRFINADGTLYAGDADTPGFAAIYERITRPYRYAWGEWRWDEYRWDIEMNYGVVPSYYDALTAPLTYFPDDMDQGVGLYPDELELQTIDEDGHPILHAGRLYLDGHQFYCYGDPVVVPASGGYAITELPTQPNPDAPILVSSGQYDQTLIGQSSLGYVLTGGHDLQVVDEIGPHIYQDYMAPYRSPSREHYTRNATLERPDPSGDITLMYGTAGSGSHYHTFLLDGKWTVVDNLDGVTDTPHAGDVPAEA